MSLSTIANDIRLVYAVFAVSDVTKGEQNSAVGVQGIVNMMCNGIPSFSAICMPANDGGLAMIASAMNLD